MVVLWESGQASAYIFTKRDSSFDRRAKEGVIISTQQKPNPIPPAKEEWTYQDPASPRVEARETVPAGLKDTALFWGPWVPVAISDGLLFFAGSIQWTAAESGVCPRERQRPAER
jgi:hypothetical protein